MIAAPQDIRDRARRRLPHFLFEYVDGGATAEATLQANSAALSKVRLRQKVMRDVSTTDTRCHLFGHDQDLPVILGPVGLAGMLARRGEVQAARAARASGIPFCLSTVSVCGIAEVARALPEGFWFQLYFVRDRAFMADLLALARQHCSVLVLTVDMPVGAVRHRDFRSGMSGAPGLGASIRQIAQAMLRPGWAWDVGLNGRPHALGNLRPVLGGKAGMKDFAGWIARNFDPTISWDELAFIRQHWSGPIIIKGIMEPDDAELAVQAGADGIVISNHGGRQLDSVPATCEAVPAIAEHLAGRTRLLIDGGVRSGLDLFKMLALGADGVLLGRAWAFALAAGGQAGVAAMLQSMSTELKLAMAMTSCRSLADITSDVLV